MKYGNFYDLESLTLLNRHEGCACSIKECDVEKVNRLISRMREDRERVSLPTAGDVVTYTTRGGDYYPQAHIERGDDREVHICLLPQTPFCHENEKCTGYNTEGGPWVITGPELLLPDGIRSKQFRISQGIQQGRMGIPGYNGIPHQFLPVFPFTAGRRILAENLAARLSPISPVHPKGNTDKKRHYIDYQFHIVLLGMAGLSGRG